MNNQYYHAWLTLIGQRDALYIMMALIAATCLLWHKLGIDWLGQKTISRIALSIGGLGLGLGWAWGMWRWLWA